MGEPIFAQRQAGGLSYYEAGCGDLAVAIAEEGDHPACAYALLAERRRVLVFALPADAAMPQEAAHRIGAALAALAIERFDLMAEGGAVLAALWLARACQADIGSVILVAPAGAPDDAFRDIERPVLILRGTKDRSDAADRYRASLPDCHFMFVYDAGRTIAAERPEALAFIAGEFFERRDLFLVSRESGVAFP